MALSEFEKKMLALRVREVEALERRNEIENRKADRMHSIDETLCMIFLQGQGKLKLEHGMVEVDGMLSVTLDTNLPLDIRIEE